MANLTDNHRRFVEAKAGGLKDKEAAIFAGYSAASAQSTASRLMSRTDIKAAIKAAKGVPQTKGDHDVDRTKESLLKPSYKTSLELLQDLYNNPKAPVGMRVEAAKLALPYEHGKIGEQGKKEAKQQAAKEAAGTGRFAPRGRPKLHAVA